MPELLLEVGTEELPASAVERASTELADRIETALLAAHVLEQGYAKTAFGTPRRLIACLSEVRSSQPDQTVEQRGPGVKAAYAPDGAPTQALLGFCRSQGIETSALRDDGQYVWATKQISGRSAATLLADILPKAIRSLSFDKSMRWGSSRLRFARPIRWLLAAFDGRKVEFHIEDVQAGLQSRGHRFYAPEGFEATSLSELLEGLRERKVEPDPSVRRALIVSGAKDVCQAPAEPELPENLVEENVYLTEWPTAITGEFETAFLELPPPVLVTAMAKHEKMFPVRSAGDLTNRFVFIRNSGEDESVRKGCQWVLNARFNDAKFFFDEDKKHSLDEFLERTSGILFQEKLGTVRQRCERLSRLAPIVAPEPDMGGERALAEAAGRYSKADLSTGLVSELASLQGIVGAEYGRRGGFAEEVCHALETQYDLSKSQGPSDAASRTAIRLVMADQLDKLAGYLGLGLSPSGSSDPYALRRAASLLIEAALNWPGRLSPFLSAFSSALELYRDQGIQLGEANSKAALCELFASRYPNSMPDARYDVLQAAILNGAGEEATDPQSVRFRVRILSALTQDVPFVQMATRPMNIVIAARKKGVEFGESNPLQLLEHSALESASGLEILEIVAEQQELLKRASREDRDEDAIRMLRSLAAPINRFFEDTMVMVEEPEVRFARLTLMHAVSLQLLIAGDFTKIVIEGDR